MKLTHSKQRGAALVIGLILLVVITLLAVVGMNIANTELASATSEQLRLRAFNAAETGLEARLQTLAVDANTDPAPVESDILDVENSPLNTVTGEAADTYSTITTYRGEGNMLSRYSAGTFVGFHYSIESTGRSSRKGQLLSRAGRFSLCAQMEALPYKYVSVEGPIVSTQPADHERDLRPIARRYLGAEEGDRYIERTRHDPDYAGVPIAVIEDHRCKLVDRLAIEQVLRLLHHLPFDGLPSAIFAFQILGDFDRPLRVRRREQFDH